MAGSHGRTGCRGPKNPARDAADYGGAVITRDKASLRLFSETHRAADVTAVLGLEPTRSAERGDPKGRARRDASGALVPHLVHRTSLWQLDAPEMPEMLQKVEGAEEPGGHAFEAVERLVELLRGRATQLAQLRENYEMDIVYGGFSDSWQGGFVVPAPLLVELGELGCDLLGSVSLLEPDGHFGPGDGALEQVVLPVKPGREAAFELAFAEARHLVEQADGFRRLSLSRGVEEPGTYLLLIEWDDVDSHERGFRGSTDYQRWSALLHPFYEPMPVVRHYAEVVSVDGIR
jgi:heme-degrading monooxygenase HmoA